MNMNDRNGQDEQGMSQPVYNVELHIDEIVLHGFAHRDRYAIQEAIQRELTRLIAERGISSSLQQGEEDLTSTRDVTPARLDAGTMTMHRGMSPNAIGTQVAQTVYRGLMNNAPYGQNNGQASRGVIQ